MKTGGYFILGIVLGIIVYFVYKQLKNTDSALKTIGGELGACIKRCMHDNPTWTTEDCRKDCSNIIGNTIVINTPLRREIEALPILSFGTKR